MMIKTESSGKIDYLACFPNDFHEGKKYPLIIHLHGAGSRNSDPTCLKNQAIMRYAEKTADFPFVMFLPYCKEKTWFDIFEHLTETIPDLVSLPYIDKDKVYLSGASMGGYGAWQLLMSLNKVFNKAIICCGGGMYWNADQIKAQVWAFHGDKDPIVYPDESQKMVDAVNKHGGTAKLTLYSGVDHNAWDPTYFNPEIYEWLLSE